MKKIFKLFVLAIVGLFVAVVGFNVKVDAAVKKEISITQDEEVAGHWVDTGLTAAVCFPDRSTCSILKTNYILYVCVTKYDISLKNDVSLFAIQDRDTKAFYKFKANDKFLYSSILADYMYEVQDKNAFVNEMRKTNIYNTFDTTIYDGRNTTYTRFFYSNNRVSLNVKTYPALNKSNTYLFTNVSGAYTYYDTVTFKKVNSEVVSSNSHISAVTNLNVDGINSYYVYTNYASLRFGKKVNSNLNQVIGVPVITE